MLSRECAAKLKHEIGDILRDGFELTDAVLGFHIDHGPHVQTADRGMRINAGGGLMLANDRHESVDVIAQLFRRHGRVLDERQRLRVFLHRHRKTQRRFAQIPDTPLRRRIDCLVIAIPEALARKILFQRGQPRRQVRLESS